ncbi:MAG TPA: hypothetical protein EYQ31_11135 [Candidatus Handelsmanbacteria bacterium]|nr:hypothetical protein [Candidatus Handelsmanbacteria bacterium]
MIATTLNAAIVAVGCGPASSQDTEVAEVDADADGYSESQGDCDDHDSSVYPGATEYYNETDDDCDGLVDEGTVAFDDDGDGQSELDGDCDDADDTIYWGAPEVCDGVDNDCDELIDEGTECVDDDGDGYSELEGDCDDGDSSVYPGASDTDYCDAVDQDCDGNVAYTGDDFLVEVQEVDFPAYPADETGCWDYPECDPDPFVCIETYDPTAEGGATFGGDCSATQMDNWSPAFNFSANLTVLPAEFAAISAYDQDGSGYQSLSDVLMLPQSDLRDAVDCGSTTWSSTVYYGFTVTYAVYAPAAE